MVAVTFGNDRRVELPEGMTALPLRSEASRALGRSVIAGTADGIPIDAGFTLTAPATFWWLTKDSPEGLEVLRHSTSHLMAQAVQELFPGTKIAIGPAIEEGFYYDFDSPRAFTPEDLTAIEERMRGLASAALPITREVWPKEKAISFYKEQGEAYKVELIEAIADETITVYRQGGYADLCRGPHLLSTKEVGHFKLLSVAGAYWRGSEKNPMLQRIYGTAFFGKKELEEHLNRIEEAKKRDHRVLGKALGLFSFHDEAGAGFPFYHPKGALLRILIEDFERREHLRRGYQIVMGPTLLKKDLWVKSGHYDNYRENMYFTEIDGVDYGVKPMNCLAHMLIYKSALRSYRDLPLRLFELGTVHRHEKAGVLHGLLRVRAFTQDDAHIICRPDQLEQEIVGVLDFVKEVMALFGFTYHLELSTRPEKAIGSDEDWERATTGLRGAMEGHGLAYKVNEGDGAFYGPKIDVKIKDAIGRTWQCATIQCDFTLPDRFDLTYIGEDGKEHRPVMIHRVILGSIERFIAVLIEHFAGAFPLWIAPVQVKVMTITDAQNDYAAEVNRKLLMADLRSEADLRNEKVGFKIREAQLEKIPYMLVAGDREVSEGTVSVRNRLREDLGTMTVDAFIERARREVTTKAIW
jgi:threonyl-tRNA synthetase